MKGSTGDFSSAQVVEIERKLSGGSLQRVHYDNFKVQRRKASPRVIHTARCFDDFHVLGFDEFFFLACRVSFS
jgi:hypothetical protein